MSTVDRRAMWTTTEEPSVVGAYIAGTRSYIVVTRIYGSKPDVFLAEQVAIRLSQSSHND